MHTRDANGRLRDAQGRFVRPEDTALGRQLQQVEQLLLGLDPESLEHRDAVRTRDRWKAELFGP
jgi:hypothetical protein